MSDPQDEQKLLAEIRDTQREHLAQYKAVTARLLASQELAVRRARKALYVLVAAVAALAVIWFISPNGPLWCVINAARRTPPFVADGEDEQPGAPSVSRYRYTAAQLDEIRDAEERFVGVETITALVKAFGEPDLVIDSTVDREYTKRKFVYHRRWKAIDVDVYEYFGGKYGLMIVPKAAATQPHELG